MSPGTSRRPGASQTSFPDQDSAIVLSLSNLVFKACIDPSSSVYDYPVKTYIHLILTAIKSSNICRGV